MTSRRQRTSSRRMRRSAAGFAAALAIAGAACGVRSTEEQVLDDFFHAARIRDTTMVARVSDVDFHPGIEGVVERFDVEDTRSTDGNDAARVVRLDARVRRLDGSIQDRQLTATLRRTSDGRWRLVKLSS